MFLRKALGNDLIGCMHVSPFIRSQERGEIKPFSELEPENRALMESIEQTLAGREKNWQQYMERTIDVHRKNAKSWGNDSIGIDLETQIDPTFQYAD